MKPQNDSPTCHWQQNCFHEIGWHKNNSHATEKWTIAGNDYPSLWSNEQHAKTNSNRAQNHLLTKVFEPWKGECASCFISIDYYVQRRANGNRKISGVKITLKLSEHVFIISYISNSFFVVTKSILCKMGKHILKTKQGMDEQCALFCLMIR